MFIFVKTFAGLLDRRLNGNRILCFTPLQLLFLPFLKTFVFSLIHLIAIAFISVIVLEGFPTLVEPLSDHIGVPAPHISSSDPYNNYKTLQECETALTSQFNSLKNCKVLESWKKVGNKFKKRSWKKIEEKKLEKS